jgi:hypothetical protein
MSHHHHELQCLGLQSSVRNRYFYGKLLDVYQLELEQNYFNRKRWLLNRLVTGYGVICGLNVTPAEEGSAIIVQPGLALDKWGREIIVCEPSKPICLPCAPPSKGEPEKADPMVSTGEPSAEVEAKPTGKKQSDRCDDNAAWNHIVLCYHECLTDPVPTLGDDCTAGQRCAPGAIRERYEIRVEPGKAPGIHLQCSIRDLVPGNRIDYAMLAYHVSQPCRDCADDPCITLANVRFPDDGGRLSDDDIDITVRPIVFTNDLLFEIIVGLLRDEHNAPRGAKP